MCFVSLAVTGNDLPRFYFGNMLFRFRMTVRSRKISTPKYVDGQRDVALR